MSQIAEGKLEFHQNFDKQEYVKYEYLLSNYAQNLILKVELKSILILILCQSVLRCDPS